MATKTFKVTWNSGSTLTKDNVRRALKHHFATEFEVEEIKEAPVVNMDLLKTKKKVRKVRTKSSSKVSRKEAKKAAKQVKYTVL